MNTLLSYLRRRNKTAKLADKIMKKQVQAGNLTNYNLNKYFAYQTYLHSKIPKSKH